MIRMRDDDPATVLLGDLRAIFGARLLALVAYGEHAHRTPAAADPEAPLHTLAQVAAPLAIDDLQACAARVDRWSSRGIAVPLLLTGDEFARSLDAFPLEYGAIIADHRLVHGRDPFDGLTVRADDVRRACEVQAKSHLLHLREGFVEAAGRATDLAALIAASAPALRALLTSVARLQGRDASDPDALGRFSETLHLPADAVRAVLALRSPRDLGPIEAERIFPAYLDAAERLARFVDTWTA